MYLFEIKKILIIFDRGQIPLNMHQNVQKKHQKVPKF